MITSYKLLMITSSYKLLLIGCVMTQGMLVCAARHCTSGNGLLFLCLYDHLLLFLVTAHNASSMLWCLIGEMFP